jgi:hypothetical protein
MYNKLFTKILDSSIWLEPDATRIVWLTCLAAMDETGFAQFAGTPNLAHRANVSLEAALEAVACLESADLNSSDPDNEGRRIERVPGGWMVLNAGKYRALVTRLAAKEQNRVRVARHREMSRIGHRVSRIGNGPVMPSEADTEADTKAKAKAKRKNVSSATVKNTVTEPAVLTFSTVGTPSEWHLTQTQIDAWSLAFPQTDVLGEARKALAWVLAKQRKTAKGMPVFLVTWLGKAANGPVRASQRPSPETHGRTGAPARGKYDHIQDA